jgi:4-hydroxy-tetrahydrodipicolinate synthase
MSDLSRVKGCGTALVTPFNEDRSIDEEALARLVEFQISEGIDFLVPCGTTGESVTLSSSEQLRVVEVVLGASRGRVPVIAGAGGYNTSHVIELAAEFERLGVDGLLSVTPYYNKPTQEGLYQHFRAIAESTRLPIIVYNVPSRTSVNMLPDTVVRLAEIENVQGVKEACGDISQIADLATRAPADFKIFSGDDSVTLPVVAVGGAGVISVAGNEAPRKMAAMTRAAVENGWDEARRLNRELFPLMKVNFIETSPGPVKAALAMMGKIKEIYRLPMVPVSSESKARIRDILIRLNLIEEKLFVEAN